MDQTDDESEEEEDAEDAEDVLIKIFLAPSLYVFASKYNK